MATESEDEAVSQCALRITDVVQEPNTPL